MGEHPREGGTDRFNGAALFRARRSLRLAPRDDPRDASTEPRSFERGDLDGRFELSATFSASTEPRSFERGDAIADARSIYERAASTEPRSFERGDRSGSARERSDFRLQRSRALSSAEMAAWFERRAPDSRASTEPRSFERGDAPPALASDFRLFKLQRSRALSSAEMLPPVRSSARRSAASTEPRSFERGDGSAREIHSRGFYGFNGAALFRARRYHRHLLRPDEGCRFNGAALFRARRFLPAAVRPESTSQLQRSRALSSAEMSPAAPQPACAIERFNGAALFRARRSFARISIMDTHRASTEPRSFERGDIGRCRFARGGCGRFNGAALFRARRLCLNSGSLQGWSASTEPRSFERGDTPSRARRSSMGKLQRSRALSSAEIERPK